MSEGQHPAETPVKEFGEQDALGRFVAFLRKKGMKVTEERLEVCREIFQTAGHFEADDLLIRLRQQGKPVSKATIYRTLPLLLESGLVRQSFLAGEKQTYYENTFGLKGHEHLICVSCGKVIEFTSPQLDHLLKTVTAEHGFQQQRRRIEIFGLCEDCL